MSAQCGAQISHLKVQMPSIADALEELNDKAMTRKEQIKEYLRVIGSGDMENIPFDVGFECGVEWADSHPHWISVEDELPKERDWYLIYDTNMGHDVCMWYGDCWGNCYKVTHWMPLPQAPMKGDRDND